MRKLKLQMQLSLDGYVCGTNDEMDWLTWDWDDALKYYVQGITDPVDTILLGRKLAQGFIPARATRAADPATRDAFSLKMHTSPKVVFSSGPDQWNREDVRVTAEPLEEVVHSLKQEEGGDIMAYGGASLTSALIASGLIDEYHLFVNPATIGAGKSIFPGRHNLELVEARPFDCGIVLLRYMPTGN